LSIGGILTLGCRALLGMLVAGALCLAGDPASAAVDHGQVQRIEKYLNGIRTVEAQFVQVSSTGEAAEGTLYLSRPGRLRIEYAPPSPILIVADETFLVYYDKDLEQVSHIPLGSTPAGILLDGNIRLTGGDLTVTALTSGGGTIRLGVVRTDNPGEGALTLVFSDPPLTLRQWEITDSQGIVTTVSLVSARFGVTLDRKLFRFEDPTFFRDADR
jgi:outer membrane lipoprotein-sorting protein